MNYELQEVEMQIAFIKHTIRQYQIIQKTFDIPDRDLQKKIDNALDVLAYLVEKRDKLKSK